MKKTKPVKKYKIKYKSIIVCFLVIYIVYFLINQFLSIKISNIYILNNIYLSDQEIIEIANLQDYPNTFKNRCGVIKDKLLKNDYIKDVKVSKKNLSEVYIDVIENTPLFYNLSLNKTVLSNNKTVDDKLNVPTLINYVPDTIYDKFIEKMNLLNSDILNRISEIEYNPNDVDTERFILTMIDDNYVYLTLYKFESINNYTDIIKNFEDKKGILYLDSGEYFKVME